MAQAGAGAVNVGGEEGGRVVLSSSLVDDAPLRPVAVAVTGSLPRKQQGDGQLVGFGGHERGGASRDATADHQQAVVGL